MVAHLTVQLVSNWLVTDDMMPSAVETVMRRVRPSVPPAISIDIKIETSLDVICRIITNENAHPQGRRYGHPIIDMARELNRYMHPEVRDAGTERSVGRAIRECLEARLHDALHGKCQS
jgi:hypothetical protein